VASDKPVGVALLFSAASFYLFSSVGPYLPISAYRHNFPCFAFSRVLFSEAVIAFMYPVFIPKLHGIVWALI